MKQLADTLGNCAVPCTARALLSMLVLAVAVAGCTTTPDAPPFPNEAQSDKPLILESGDEVEIRFLYTPELNDTQVIRPDGKLSLPFLQDVVAAGRTASELQVALEEAYSVELREPEITVIVRNIAGQRFYVGGQVESPGLYPLAGSTTALEAVMQAGGFITASAKRSTVVLVRREQGQRIACTLNLREAVTQASSSPTYLKPGDIVYVPETEISQVNRWVDQYLDGVIPSDVFFALRTIDELTEDNDFDDDELDAFQGSVSTFTPSSPADAP